MADIPPEFNGLPIKIDSGGYPLHRKSEIDHSIKFRKIKRVFKGFSMPSLFFGQAGIVGNAGLRRGAYNRKIVE